MQKADDVRIVEYQDVHQRAFKALNVEITHQRVLTPYDADAAVAHLSDGRVVILPATHQVVTGRPIVGLSFEVDDMGVTRQVLREADVEQWPSNISDDERIVVSPEHAHGLWIEFRSKR